jgi:hypothetical protein
MPLRIYSRSAVSLETNTTTYLIGYCPSGVTCHATQPSSTAYRYRRNSHAHRPTRPRVNRFLEMLIGRYPYRCWDYGQRFQWFYR